MYHGKHTHMSLFFLPEVSIFFFVFQRALYYFVGKTFFDRIEAVVWQSLLEKMSYMFYVAKFIRKQLYWSLFFCKVAG